LNGKFIKAYFDYGIGKRFYPVSILLLGKIVKIKDYIYFAFQSIPKLWRLDLNGNILDSVDFGGTDWKIIKYDRKEFLKSKKKKRSMAILELILSGDFIEKLTRWKNNIVVNVVRNAFEENPENCFIVISYDFKKVSKVIRYKDYEFSGSGKYIYLSKELEIDSNYKKCEVLVCDLKF